MPLPLLVLAFQQFVVDGRVYGHILDPRTGLPAQCDLRSVTVVADRCEQAEVAAKVAFILGSKLGADFLRKHHIAGLLVHEEGTWETVPPFPIDLMEEVSN